MLRSLREFGYRIDAEHVQASMTRLLDPDYKPVGGPEMFIRDWLKEAGLREEQS
jgi:hypothetical protein